MEAIKTFFSKIGANERVEFYGFTLTLVKSGQNLQTSMSNIADILERQAGEIMFGKGRLLATAKLYRYVEERLRQGMALHEALDGRVPDSELMMLMAGSRGNLADGLEAAMLDAKASSEMKAAFAKGLMYPLGLAALVVVAMNWIGGNLLPTLIKLKPLNEWTESQQTLYWATNNVGTWLPMVLLAVIALIALIILVNKTVVGGTREKIHSIPPLNVIRKITAATYLTTLSSLVTAGETLKTALERMSASSSSDYLVHYVEQSLNNFRAGLASQGPGKALGSKLFSPWVMVKLEIYSKGGEAEFADKMLAIANDARGEAMETIGKFSKLISTGMLIVAAGVIGFTVLTMYGITGSLQGGM